MVAAFACGSAPTPEVLQVPPTSEFSLTDLPDPDDIAVYPPTACKLRSLTGDAFPDLLGYRWSYGRQTTLSTLGGPRPAFLQADGGVLIERMCRGDCVPSAIWLHPDGGVVVAIGYGGLDSERPTELTLYADRPALAKALPASMEAFVAEHRSSWGDQTHVVWKAADTTNTAPCSGADIAALTARFRAARDGTGCDATFSDFYQPAVVMSAQASFHAAPTAEPGPDFVATGNIVLLTTYRPQGAFVCAKHKAVSGAVTTGWLAEADLQRGNLGNSHAVDLASLRPVPAPPWLSPTARAFGGLHVAKHRKGIHVENDEGCWATGDFDPTRPGLYQRVDPIGFGEACTAQFATFANGVLLWTTPECDGRPAECDSVFLASAP